MRGLARAHGRFSLLRESFKAPPGTNGDTRARPLLSDAVFFRYLYRPFRFCLPVCLPRSPIPIRSIIKRLIIGLIAPGVSSGTLGTVDFRRPDRNNLIYGGRVLAPPRVPPHVHIFHP